MSVFVTFWPEGGARGEVLIIIHSLDFELTRVSQSLYLHHIWGI